MRKVVDVDINSAAVQECIKVHGEIFTRAMSAMVEACQVPGADTETNLALILRSAVAYASGIAKTLHVRPEQFAELMHGFGDFKIEVVPTSHKIRFPK